MHVDESLAAVEVVDRFEGAIVDVGSGGGAPGIPLAAALPDRQVTLLEANGRKCAFLREAAREFPNVEVVQGRAEEQETEQHGVAVAKALGAPPVAAEWCLPLAAVGGAVVLYVGPSADAPGLSTPSRCSEEAPARLVRTVKRHALVAVAMSACASPSGQSTDRGAGNVRGDP